ncbi:MAG TPA: hypothetical protein VFN57_02390 [Thermomicrobiaceae bacterium]|nr:hypothetical protein [Thermomicrobiaceae bacterium]
MAAAPAGDEWEPHDVSVRNFIFGDVWLLTLPMGRAWEWRRGPSLPEVDSTVRRGNRMCAASGRAWYALHDRDSGYDCELTIDIRPGAETGGWERWTRGLETSAATIGSHDGRVARGRTHRGLIRRVELQLLRAEVGCPLTERLVRVEFVGNARDEIMDQLQAGLAHLRCH